MSKLRWPFFLITLIVLSCIPVLAATESVYVSKAMNDKTIITRRNGDSYLIATGVGCPALWRYEGKKVIATSPGLFLGVGSRILIPELNQDCRVWSAELLSGTAGQASGANPYGASPADRSAAPAAPTASAAIVTIQNALRLAGFDPGPSDGQMGSRTFAALEKYTRSKGRVFTAEGLGDTLRTLATDVVRANPSSQQALLVSRQLVHLLNQGVADPSPSPAPSWPSTRTDCENGHWISSVASGGQFVQLENGSLWEISSLDRIRTMLWLVTEGISICGNRLINTAKGQSATATRIR